MALAISGFGIRTVSVLKTASSFSLVWSHILWVSVSDQEHFDQETVNFHLPLAPKSHPLKCDASNEQKYWSVLLWLLIFISSNATHFKAKRKYQRHIYPIFSFRLAVAHLFVFKIKESSAGQNLRTAQDMP